VNWEAARELWQERTLLLPAFASAFGVGYMSLLVLPWSIGALVAYGHYSEVQSGWIATSEIAALAATSLWLARVSTAPARRRLAIAGTLAAILANAVAAVIPPSGIAFIAARLVSGAGMGAAVAVGNATAAGAKNPTRGFALLWFLLALWQLVVFNAAPWAISHAGLPGAYGLIAAGCLIWLPFIARIQDPVAPAVGANSETRAYAIFQVLPLIALAALLCFWLRDAMVYSMWERLAAAHGLTGQFFGKIMGIASLCGLTGPLLAARLGKYQGSLGILAGGLLAVLVTSSATVLAESSSQFTIATLVGPATGMFAISLLSGLLVQVDPTGRLAAIGAGVGIISEALGPALAGVLLGYAGRIGLSLGVIAAGTVCLAAGLAATVRIHRRRKEA